MEDKREDEGEKGRKKVGEEKWGEGREKVDLRLQIVLDCLPYGQPSGSVRVLCLQNTGYDVLWLPVVLDVIQRACPKNTFLVLVLIDFKHTSSYS